jgi:hypothetical protein
MTSNQMRGDYDLRWAVVSAFRWIDHYALLNIAFFLWFFASAPLAWLALIELSASWHDLSPLEKSVRSVILVVALLLWAFFFGSLGNVMIWIWD